METRGNEPRGVPVKRGIQVMVLVVWGVMLAAFIRKEYLSPWAEVSLPEDQVAELQDRAEWMGIYLKGRKVGFASTRMRRTPDGFHLKEDTSVRLRLLGVPREIHSSLSAVTDESFRLMRFHFSLRSGPVDYRLDGRVEGGALLLVTHTGGRTRRSRITLPETPWLSQTVRYLFFRRPPHLGDRFDLPLLDPLTGKVLPLRVSVEQREVWRRGGRDVPVYRLSYTWGPIRLKCWVNEAGETLKEEGWGGFTLVRETPEEALTRNWADDETPDLIQMASIPVRKAPERARSLSFLLVRFSGLDWEGLHVEDHRQRRREDLLEVRREDSPRSRGCSLPLNSDLGEVSKEMEPTPLIQSDDERIRALAARIAGGEREAAVVARRILRWVHGHLDKVPTVSVPSAVEVLEMGQGDCNEHAVLFAALARASGIPTRVVAGLLLHEGRFYYHAWNEVYLCGWYSADPLLGQMPTDAGHVRLVTGDLGDEIRLLPTVGRIRAEVVTYR